jgi:hypothetical protein
MNCGRIISTQISAVVARKKLDTGQQFYEDQREIAGRVSSHVAGQQRGAKGHMAVRGKRATCLVINGGVMDLVDRLGSIALGRHSNVSGFCDGYAQNVCNDRSERIFWGAGL